MIHDSDHDSVFDIVIVGGGPAGLSAALLLARARKRVLCCDAGPRRNARATQIHGYVTRDGTPPDEFRRIAHAQLRPYPDAEVCELAVEAIVGERDHFTITLAEGRVVEARRVLLCTGMIDVLPELPGVRELWGESIFQCPYCHGWEVRDRPLAYLAPNVAMLDWSRFLLGWSADVVVLTDGRFEVPDELREPIERAGVRIDERHIRALIRDEQVQIEAIQLEAIEFEDGDRLARGALFMHPPQRQTPLVETLGLELDELGFLRVDEQRQTSRPGIHAAGDLITPMQGAQLAAAAGILAGHAINHELTLAMRRASARTRGETSG
ncbi:NAD(P)/FAD-dependent oxidoreductase [Nannocystaceae bacterium ST9]